MSFSPVPVTSLTSSDTVRAGSLIRSYTHNIMRISFQVAVIAFLANATFISAIPTGYSESVVQARDGNFVELQARVRTIQECRDLCTAAGHTPNTPAWESCVNRCVNGQEGSPPNTPPPTPPAPPHPHHPSPPGQHSRG